MSGLRIGSLFSGIGGLELGLERAGVGHTVWQVEVDSWARGILRKHWPEVPCHDDVRTFQPAAGSADLVCGGFPCQDISQAGRGAGIKEGTRSGLWTEFVRVIRLVGPRLVVVENVAILRKRGLDRVLGDLAALGYDAEWDCVPAASVGAPHLRDRIFILAHRNDGRRLHGQAPEHAAEGGQPPQRQLGASRPTVADAKGEGGQRLPAEERPQDPDAPGGSQVSPCPDEPGWWHIDGFDYCVDAEGLAQCRQGVLSDAGCQRREEGPGRGLPPPGRPELGQPSPGADTNGSPRGQAWPAIGALGGRPFGIGPAQPGRRRQPPSDADCFGRGARQQLLSERQRNASGSGWWATEPLVGRVANGVPHRVDRLRGLGNGVVPQVAEFIGGRIRMIEATFSIEEVRDGR